MPPLKDTRLDDDDEDVEYEEIEVEEEVEVEEGEEEVEEEEIDEEEEEVEEEEEEEEEHEEERDQKVLVSTDAPALPPTPCEMPPATGMCIVDKVGRAPQAQVSGLEEENEDEDEYEEIEVEEEIIEEEEVDEEEIEEEVEEEEDEGKTNEDNVIALNMGSGEDIKGSGEDFKGLKLRSSVPDECEETLPSHAFTLDDPTKNHKTSDPSHAAMERHEEMHFDNGDFKPLSLEKCLAPSENMEGQESAPKEDDVICPKRKSPNGNDDILNGEKDQLCCGDDEKMDSPKRRRVNCSIEEGGVGRINIDKEIKHVDLQIGDDKKQMTPRLSNLAASEVKLGSLSPKVDLSDDSKRPDIICDFFAKGWCIKGSSCRFVHVKDHVASQQSEGRPSTSNFKQDTEDNEGLRDSNDKLRLASVRVPPESIIENGSTLSQSSERTEEHKIIQHQNHFVGKGDGSSLERGGNSFSTPDIPQLPLYKDDEREYLRWGSHAFSSRKYTSKVGSLSLDQTKGFSPYAIGQEDRAGNEYQYLANNRPLSQMNCSISNIGDGTCLTGGMMLPHHSSAWNNSSPVAQNFLHSEYYTPRGAEILLSCSASGYEQENLSDIAGDPLLWAKSKAKIFSYCWEPSIPFRSSFVAHTGISSPGSPYDPLRDSIEQPSMQEQSLRHHFVGNKEAFSTPGSKCEKDGLSASSPSRFYEHMLDKDYGMHGKDLYGIRAETAENSVVGQNENVTPGLGPDIVKGTSDIYDNNNGHEIKYKNNKERHKNDLREGRVKKATETAVACEASTDAQKDPRTLRHFRAVLIDFVKELLKPSWREGRLSKDAHNKIVKKAVEKVIGTIQPQQVPTTVELTNQYLSSSRPKITKLVEGYVEKYGKS